ncbi:MAG: phosphate signaling complex protein PhoU [bacterium]|nr:phosphate signaling complex protein PhoU [bacterium]
MSIHFQRELEQLRKRVLTVGTAVEEAIAKSVAALIGRDARLAEEVIRGDGAIDQMEVTVEEDCLKILALYQPVALDLRFIVAVLKMNNDLERMGDHAVNIAKRAAFLARRDPLEWPDGIEAMGADVQRMVKEALDSLVRGDGDLARKVMLDDDQVDAAKRRLVDALRERLRDQPEHYESLLKMIDVPRQLERIADLATNIAEDVVYMVQGAIARHHSLDE